MKKLIIIFIVLCCFKTNGQNNPGFENWEVNSQGIEVPEFWNTNNVQNSISVSKSTSSFSGTYAARIESNGISFEGNAPGLLYATWTDLNIPMSNIIFSLNVDSLSNAAIVKVVARGYASGNLIFSDTTSFSMVTDGWTSEELVLSDTLTVCDSVEVVFSAHTMATPTGFVGFAQFLLDDVSFNQPLSTSRLDGLSAHVNIYPNPTLNGFFIESPDYLSISSVQLANLSGSVLRRYNSDSRHIDVSAFSKGTYILKIETSQGAISKKIVIR
jgi:hypothetical protein